MSRWPGLCLALLAAALCGGGGCGGGGGGGDDDGGGVQGFKFTPANMMDGATAGADAVAVFPDISMVSLQVIEALQAAPAARAAVGRVVQIPLEGLCATGTASSDWNDADDDNALSAGDAVALTFAACRLEGDTASVDGAVSYAFSSVVLPTTVTATVTLNLSIQDVVDAQVHQEGINASFLVQATLAATQATFVYGAVDRSDVWATTLDGLSLRFGCFDVTHVFAPNSPETFTLQARGIANVNGKIMQVGSYFSPDPALAFQPVSGYAESPPVAGTVTLLSFDGRPSAGHTACTAVESPGEVDSDGSYLVLTATGGGNLKVDLFDSSNTRVTSQTTTWMEVF